MVSPAAPDSFELDLARYEFRRNGRAIRLEKQPMELLILLVERRGELVTREQIIARLWGSDTFVDFNAGINKAISKIRLALADDPDHPRCLETVVGKGYRLIVPVTLSPAPAASGAALPAPPRHFAVPAGVAVALVLAGGLILGVIVWRQRLRNASDHPVIHSIAVLPLVNLSGDREQEYFAEAVTDQLITDLARLSSLRVVSHTSVMQFQGSARVPLPEVARRLGVDAIVEGTVLRSGERTRVNLRLIYGPGDRQLWAESYERARLDEVTLQRELARTIADHVGIAVTTQEMARLRTPPRVKPEAYDAYLRGRYYWLEAARRGRQGEFEKSGRYFRESLRLDSMNALAYSGLADYYGVSAVVYGLLPASVAWPRAEQLAMRALALDDSLAEAHNSLAAARFFYAHDWAGAEREFRRGIAVNSRYSEIHSLYAGFLAAMGRFDEAVAEARRAEAIDPLPHESQLLTVLIQAHRFDEVRERCRRMLGPEPAKAHTWLAQMYREQGRYAEWFREDQARLASYGDSATLVARARAFQQGGIRAVWEWDLAVMQRRPTGAVGPTSRAELYALLGNGDLALRWLEEAVRRSDGEAVFLNVQPDYNGIRSSPAFRALVHRVGLPGR